MEQLLCLSNELYVMDIPPWSKSTRLVVDAQTSQSDVHTADLGSQAITCVQSKPPKGAKRKQLQCSQAFPVRLSDLIIELNQVKHN